MTKKALKESGLSAENMAVVRQFFSIQGRKGADKVNKALGARGRARNARRAAQIRWAAVRAAREAARKTG